MKSRLLLLAGALLLLALTLFTVDETQVALVTAFGPTGRVVRTVESPGLHAKFPWQGRRKFDARLRLYNARPSECLTEDKKNLVIDWYLCWRVADARSFFQSVQSPAVAELRLEETMRGLLTAEIGHTSLEDLINLEGAQIGELSEAVLAKGRELARKQYGIEMVDVQLRRLNLPEQNKQSVFDRMRAERERIARQYRAQGEEEARRIRAEADREKETILSEAYRDSEKLRGQGDAEAARIYSSAHNAGPQFYRFQRTLDTYDTLLGADTTVVLSADSPLLKTLTDGQVPGEAP